jgi:tetratricopeptide (TPR) repeat protein
MMWGRLARVLVAPLGCLVAAAALFSSSGLAQGFVSFGQANGPPPVRWVEPTALGADTVERLLASYDEGRYEAFDALAQTLTAAVINPFEFEADAEPWINRTTERPRRALVAAAVALELAATSVRREPTVTHFQFMAAELGCSWLRDQPASPAERSWHAAFVAFARRTGREGDVIVIAPPTAILERLGVASGRLGAAGDRARRDEDARWKSAHGELVARLRRDARHVSDATRIDGGQWRVEHRAHLLARFPDDPLGLFLEATVRERERPVTLQILASSLAPVWLDGEDAERIAAGGARQVGAVSRNRRMERTSAERFLRVVPEPESAALSSLLPRVDASAAFASLALWDVVDAFLAVPAREPVAAEASLRLGQTYLRLARPDLALPALARAESLATTPYESYLARLFAGAALAHSGRRADAIAAFHRALRAVPRAQAASFALAPLLLEADATEEAASILEAATTLPLVDDPLRHYYDGDPAAVSRALARLREEARR